MQRPAPVPAIDPARFRHLLALIGPAEAAAFRRQLASDLAACDRRIVLGSGGRDWALLRAASHDLISLAGSAGGAALHDLARELNGAAHAEAATDLAGLRERITAQIAALIAHVQTSGDREGPQ